MTVALIEGRRLKKYFPVTRGFLFAKRTNWLKAVDGVDLSINTGGTFALVGESGCGKTTTAKLIVLLERLTSGELLFEGHDVYHMNGEDLQRYRTAVQVVFQDPYSSLNPRMRVGSIVAEPLTTGVSLRRAEAKQRVIEVLEQVGLLREVTRLFPHELSGGQRQRVAIARALAPFSRLIVLDEPISALDVSIRAQVMNLLKDIQDKLGLTYFLIAHHLATVRYMATVVSVMYLGKVVETAPCQELFTHPLHPYTRALLSASLPSHPATTRKEVPLRGEIPSPLNPPSGCRLHPRCVYALPRCSQEEPEQKEAGAGHFVACHLFY